MELTQGYNAVDFVILAIFAITVILGIWKGFVSSLTGLAGLVFGVAAAVKYYPRVEPYLGKITSLEPHASMILSMVIIFVAVQVLFLIIRFILNLLIDVTRLGWLDRTLGAVMGLLAGFLVASVAVEVLLIGIPEWTALKESRLAPPVHGLAQRAVEAAPQSVKEQLQQVVDKWKGTKEQTAPKPKEQEAPPKEKPRPQSGNPFVPPAAHTGSAPPGASR